MIEHFAQKLCDAFSYLIADIKTLREREKNNPGEVLSEAHKQYIAGLSLSRMLEEIERLNFDSKVINRNRILRANLIQPDYRFSVESLLNALLNLERDVRQELHERKFAYIPPPNHKYFEQEKLFGDDVHNRIKEARQDLKDAGNCLAAGLYTACIFHRMRVAEHALRRLAKRVKPELIHKGKPTPIEYETIEKICTAIDDKLQTAHQIATKPKKKEKLKLYADAGQHCLFMKDIWRNDLSHTGEPYIEAEAVAAMDRVRGFSQFLAKALKTI